MAAAAPPSALSVELRRDLLAGVLAPRRPGDRVRASRPRQENIRCGQLMSTNFNSRSLLCPPCHCAQMALPNTRIAYLPDVDKHTGVLAYELVQGSLVQWNSFMDKSIPDPPTAVLLHGILGSRKNWGSFAKRLAQEFPMWQFLLVDLRCHGDSASIKKREPHTVASTALDVLKLIVQLRLTPRVLVGHSFGGKVALSMVEQAAKPLARPVRVWVLDATPGKVRAGGDGEDHPAELIESLRRMPMQVSSKQEVVDALIKEQFSVDVAQTNLWGIVENVPRGVHIDFLKAERSLHRWALEDLQRIHAAEELAADEGGGVEMHVLEDAGHWFTAAVISFGAGLMPAMANPTLILVLSFLISALLSPAHGGNHLRRGESLSVERTSDILLSSNGVFAFGFYNLSSTVFTISVWFAASADRTVAWTANRDRPVHGVGSKVTLRKDGSLVLSDYDGTAVWQTNSTSAATAAAELTDDGNLVVRGEDGRVLWQSFDYPTDTLLPTQPVTATARLTTTDVLHPTSFYSLRFDDRYVLSLVYDGPDISNIYWPDPDASSWLNFRISYNASRRGVLNHAGLFLASDNTTFVASDWGVAGVKRRLTLDHDGNLRLYSLRDADGSWSVSWTALPRPCDIHGLCGWNGLCVYTPQPACSCPPGYVPVDSVDSGKGCRPAFNFTFCAGQLEMDFAQLPQTDFWGSDLNLLSSMSVDECKKKCLELCNCVAFEYKDDANDCYLKSALLNGKTSPGYVGTVYLKLPAILVAESSQSSPSPDQAAVLACDAASPGIERTRVLSFPPASPNIRNTSWRYYYGFLSAFFAVELCFIAFGWWFTARSRPAPSEQWAAEEGYKVVTDHFRSFTYGELRKATRNFKDVIGHGRYGSVYKGVLATDGRAVAVKRLKGTTPQQREDEFQTEGQIVQTV
ncbi:hypothetical protein ABZP36_015460 [Zizania latifolia]